MLWFQIGISVGHLYYFLEDVFPNQPGGLKVLKTIKILKVLCDQDQDEPEPELEGKLSCILSWNLNTVGIWKQTLRKPDFLKFGFQMVGVTISKPDNLSVFLMVGT